MALAAHFDHVAASDLSEELLQQAPPHARITFRQADALDNGLGTRSADLMTGTTRWPWSTTDCSPPGAVPRRSGRCTGS